MAGATIAAMVISAGAARRAKRRSDMLVSLTPFPGRIDDPPGVNTS